MKWRNVHLPVRTILAADYGDVILSPLLQRQKGQPATKSQGAILALVGYLMLLYSYNPQQGPSGTSFFCTRSYVHAHVSNKASVDEDVGLFGLPHKVVGIAIILAAVALNMVRKKYFKGLSVQMGSTKRLFSFSVALGALFLSPVAAYSYFTVTLHLTSLH